MNFLRKLLTPPVFAEDAEKTRAASVLHAVLTGYFIIMVAIALVVLFIFTNKYYNLLFLLALAIVFIVCYFLMRRGKIWQSSLVCAASQWVLFTVFVAVSGGISSTGIVFYLGGTVMTGLMLGMRPAMLYAAASSLAGLGMLLLPALGVTLPRIFPMPPQAGWFDLTITLFVVVLAVNITLKNLKAALESSHRELDERRVVEGALRESEQRYHTLFEIASDAILLFDHSSLQILDANPAACQLYGYSLDELRRMRVMDLSAEPERTEQASRAAEAHIPLRQHRRKDGTVFTVEIYSGAFNLTGRSILVTYIRDITARRQAEEEIQQLNSDLEHRVRQRTAQLEITNRELESFSYSISHDLRAPLRHLEGYAQVLVEESGDALNPQARHSLERIQTAVQQMSQLIDALLNLSRLGRGELNLGRVDLSTLARSIAFELHRRDPQRAVEMDIQAGLVATADAALARSVLENLFENAWKFTSRRELASIRFGCLEGEEKIYFVRDNGAGFDMNYKNQMFGPFRRLHSADDYPGTGIGLAIVQRIVQRHGGRIWAEGAVDEGAVFYFTLG
jgi:PAS domain S-box-containing protein